MSLHCYTFIYLSEKSEDWRMYLSAEKEIFVFVSLIDIPRSPFIYWTYLFFKNM